MSCIGMLYCKGTFTLAVLLLLYPCIHAKMLYKKKKPDTSKQPLDVLLPMCHTSKHSHYCNKMVAPPTSLLLLRHWWQSWMHFFNDSGKKFLVHNAKGPCLSWCTQRSTKSMCCLLFQKLEEISAAKASAIPAKTPSDSKYCIPFEWVVQLSTY